MEKIRVFLADDHELVRDGLKALLQGIESFEITGEAASGSELMEKLAGVRPDVLVLDISFPDISGIDLTRRIAREYPGVKILILSMYTNENFIINSVKAGASGYLPKNTSRDELVEAIQAIHSGEDYFSGSILKVIMKSFVRQVRNPSVPDEEPAIHLSDRETEVLGYVAEGLGNREISERLGISIRTVETHKNHIMRKLGLKSPVEMIKYALKNKLAEL